MGVSSTRVGSIMSSYHQEVASVREDVQAFFRKTFSSVNIEGPRLDPGKFENTPIMLVSTHRSHVDYFLVGIIFHDLGFKNLRFAAGDNLTKLPWIGPRFTSFGAFTVERDGGFDRNYIRNLCFEVVSMIENGDTVLVFPEGGRSYSGAMLDIKTGILGASVISQGNDTKRDVFYIPAAVSYENPPDVPWFAMQLKGKLWRKRSNPLPKRLLGNLLYFGADICAFVPFLLAHKFGKKYGKIYVDYGDPVSIRSFIDVPANKAQNARDDFLAHRTSMQRVSEAVFAQLTDLYRVLPMHVIAAELKKHGSRSLTDLADSFPDVVEGIRKKGRNVKQLLKGTAMENTREGIRQLEKIGAVKVRSSVCTIRRKSLIDYFAAAMVS